MRKLAALLLVLLLIPLPGCFIRLQLSPAPPSHAGSANPMPAASPTPTPRPIPSFDGPLQPSAYTVRDIALFFEMEKDSLFGALGGGFELAHLRKGYNKPYAYYGEYENKAIGMRIGFLGTSRQTPLYIKFEPGKGVKGLSGDAGFSDIRSALGVGQTYITWRERPGSVFYCLAYDQQGYTMEFLPVRQDGAGWYLECWKAYDKAQEAAAGPFDSSYPALPADTALIKNGITLGEIPALFEVNKYELQKRLGYSYFASGFGANEYFFSFVYHEMGLRFNFGEEPTDAAGLLLSEDEMDFGADAGNTLQTIYVTGDVDLRGIHPGMSYGEVQKLLGSGDTASGVRRVYEPYYSTESEDLYYELHYDLGSYRLIFYSRQESGAYWKLLIEPER